jgi:hypothetical protein
MMGCYQMKMNLRCAAEEDDPVLLSACIERCTMVYCDSCPGLYVDYWSGTRNPPTGANINNGFAPELIGTGDRWEHGEVHLGYCGQVNLRPRCSLNGTWYHKLTRDYHIIPQSTHLTRELLIYRTRVRVSGSCGRTHKASDYNCARLGCVCGCIRS